MTEAENMVAGYGGPFRKSVVEIAENVLCIERALGLARQTMEHEPVHVIETVGVHPHAVTRENKAWVSFRNLARAHASLVGLLIDMVGAGDAEDGDDPLAEIITQLRSA